MNRLVVLPRGGLLEVDVEISGWGGEVLIGFVREDDLEAGIMTEALLSGDLARGALGSLSFSRPPPHRSTRSCTEFCRLLLFVRRRR